MQAFDTLPFIMENFREVIHRFRIGAPLASKRTSLHEYSGPDTRAVMDGITLNVEYQTFDIRPARKHISPFLLNPVNPIPDPQSRH